MHPPHAALACRSGPKGCYCSSVQFLPGGLSAGTGKLNCQTARSISLVDSDCSLNTSTERKRQVCVRHVQSKRQRRLPPPAAFPCRLKPTVPCGGNDGEHICHPASWA